jgi:tetratricopeptide (TPR) repeat protein
MQEAANHAVVFTHEFTEERARAADLPERVGAQVASQLAWTAPLLSIERRHPSDPTVIASLLQASSAGLDGVGALHDYEISRAIAAKDPYSPLAQISLAFNTAFALDQIPREQRGEAVATARKAAQRALALAPDFGDTYVPWCLLHSEQRMLDCEERLRDGMRADPDSPFAGWFLASLILNPTGQNEEALEIARASLAHDPFMPAKIALMLRMLEATGRRSEADELYRRSTKWWPGNDFIKSSRASGMAEGGDFQRLLRFESSSGKADTLLVAIAGRSTRAVQSSCSRPKHFGPLCMIALARLGEQNAAFSLADRFYPSRRGRTRADDDQIWLDSPDTSDFAFLSSDAARPLRNDHRFLDLAERVGLLNYWRAGHLPDFCRQNHEPVCDRMVRKLR